MKEFEVEVNGKKYVVESECNLGCVQKVETEFFIDRVVDDITDEEVPDGELRQRIVSEFQEHAITVFCVPCRKKSREADRHYDYLQTDEGRLQQALDEIDTERENIRPQL